MKDRLEHVPAVALLGLRQVDASARALHSRGAIRDREQSDDLVILDKVQRAPELFAVLRGLIDEGRRSGKRAGRFLLLGSASTDLLRLSEALAGRIAYIELSPLGVMEVPQ